MIEPLEALTFDQSMSPMTLSPMTGIGQQQQSSSSGQIPMDPSLWESLLSGSMGALGHVAEVLDSAARPIRNVASGFAQHGFGMMDPSVSGPIIQNAIMSIVPYTDASKLTPRFRDVLAQAGIVDANVEGFAGDWQAEIAGLIGEVALDPTTYMTLGGSALLKLGIPFTKAGIELGEQGTRAYKLAANIADNVKFSGPARIVRAALDGKVRDFTELGAQKALLQSQEEGAKVAEELFGNLHEAIEAYKKAVPEGEQLSQEVQELSRQLVEHRSRISGGSAAHGTGRKTYKEFVDALPDEMKATLDQLYPGGFADFGQQMMALLKNARNKVREEGIMLKEIKPGMLRNFGINSEFEEVVEGTGRAFASNAKKFFQNSPMLQRVDTATINALANGDLEKVIELLGTNTSNRLGLEGVLNNIRTQATANKGYKNITLADKLPANEFDDLVTSNGQALHGMFSAAGLGIKERDAQALARLLAERPGVGPIFDSHLMLDASNMIEAFSKAVVSAQAARKVIRENIVPSGGERIWSAFEKAKLAPGLSLKRFLADYGEELGVNSIEELKKLEVHKEIIPLVKRLVHSHMPDGGETLFDHVAGAKGFGFKSLEKVIPSIDDFTNAFKTGVTVPFPAFHYRNWVSGMWQNFATGAFRSIYDISHAVWDADKIATGKYLDDHIILRTSAAHPDLPNVTVGELLKEMRQHKVFQGSHADIGGRIGGRDFDPSTAIPGEKSMRLANILDFRPGSSLDVVGVTKHFGKATAEAFRESGPLGKLTAPVKGALATGADMTQRVEWSNRISAYLGWRRQGVQPMEAAARVRAAHFDYSDLSTFEKRIMKRLIPFYTFTRKNLPLQFRLLAEQPGGFAAQTVKMARSQQKDAGWSPSWIQEGVGIGLGRDAQGNVNFVTGLGLPIEDALSVIGVGPGWFGGQGFSFSQTLQNMAARANPLIKYPLEQYLGIDLFTGRKLEDIPGAYIAGYNLENLENIMSGANAKTVARIINNTPFARVLATIGKSVDPRRSLEDRFLNLMSGIKTHPINVEHYAMREAQSAAHEIMRSDPRFANLDISYGRKGAALSPQEEAMIQLANYYRPIDDQRNDIRNVLAQLAA